MPKHLEAQKTAGIIEVGQEEQQKVLDELGTLTKKSIDVIRKAVIATKVCAFCVDGKSKKINKDGNCASCNGNGVVDDFDRNKWGAEQVLGRKLPMPKAIEMRLDDKRDKEELVKSFSGLKNKAELEKMLDMLESNVTSASRMEPILSEVTEDGSDGE